MSACVCECVGKCVWSGGRVLYSLCAHIACIVNGLFVKKLNPHARLCAFCSVLKSCSLDKFSCRENSLSENTHTKHNQDRKLSPCRQLF